MITFDIETCPLPDDELRALCPAFDDSEVRDTGDFDPSSVKTGNMKDQAKIDAKIEDARLKHEQLRESLADRRTAALDKHYADFASKATLSAATSRMLVCGFWSQQAGKFVMLDASEPGNEATCLQRFWANVLQWADQRRPVVGCNIYEFDLPYLVNRSWLLGVEVPPPIYSIRGSYVNWHACFVDLRHRWLLGRRNGERSSHDHMGKAFKTGGKCVSGVDGGSFWKVWFEDRDKAVEYLMNDLKQPAIWAERMGVR